MSEDLVAWLREQIAAKEASALAVPSAARLWRFGEYAESVMVDDSNWYVACGPWGGPVDDTFGRHIADNDPAAVLAQCEAHTALLDRFDRVREAGSSGLYTEWELAQVTLMDELVDLVGLAYQHNPGYQEAWRP